MSVPGGAMSTTAKTMAVFVDADNFNDATALDRALTQLRSMADRVLYRCAYGRPDSLKGIEAVLGKHGVRPVTNVIVDKVTTDGALVIAAVEAVCTSDINMVAICSGDADFAPLAIWLREKGCKVLCYSLAGKIFTNPENFYDDVVVFDVAGTKPSEPVSRSPLPMPSTLATKGAEAAPDATGAVPKKAVSAAAAVRALGPGKAAPAGTSSLSVKAILAALPGLRDKQPMHLSLATKMLRAAGLLGKNASSPTLFRRFEVQFELAPEKQPNTVRYRG